jgi:hypothetical protein
MKQFGRNRQSLALRSHFCDRQTRENAAFAVFAPELLWHRDCSIERRAILPSRSSLTGSPFWRTSAAKRVNRLVSWRFLLLQTADK